MQITIENILLIGSLLLLGSLIVGKTSSRVGLPTLLIFLGVGMLTGSEGIIGKIEFSNATAAQFIGVISLNFILFSGGLDTNWKSVKPILKIGISLSTLGVFITALTLGYFIYLVTHLTIYESLLLGSIVSSTDAAAVFSILRSKNIALTENLRPTLELESGSNDPMAYVLTISFLTLVMNPEQGFLSIIPLFIQQMVLGALLGIGFAYLSKLIINNIRLSVQGLYPVLMITLMFIIFSLTDLFGGNGFLAIYIAGVYLGNQDLIYKKTILNMYESLAWLAQIILFLTLGLLVFPSEIVPIIDIGIIISLFLIFVARPVAVFLSLILFKMRIQRRLYISWVGLRGAVPIVFATYPLIAGIENANMMFNIVFFISVTSVLFQGTTLGIFSKWLKVNIPEHEKAITDHDILLSNAPKNLKHKLIINDKCQTIGKRLVDIGLPANAVIPMIKRKNQFITPDGATKIESGDILVVLSDQEETFKEVSASLDAKLIS